MPVCVVLANNSQVSISGADVALVRKVAGILLWAEWALEYMAITIRTVHLLRRDTDTNATTGNLFGCHIDLLVGLEDD